MKMEKNFSEEFLNAFVDNQLTSEEKSQVYRAISQDEPLNRRVCELRKLHDLLQLAYKNPSLKKNSRSNRTLKTRFSTAIASSFFLSLGIVVGWFIHTPNSQLNLLKSQKTHIGENSPTLNMPSIGTRDIKPPTTNHLAIPKIQGIAQTLAAGAHTHAVKVLLHLSSNNPQQMHEVLDDAEDVLQLYKNSKHPARVEIIANGEGLALLRVDTSPYAKRIHEMRQKYANLTFAACQNTIDRIKREQGVQVHLIPEATVVDSGVAQIILLQQQGWAYIQV